MKSVTIYVATMQFFQQTLPPPLTLLSKTLHCSTKDYSWLWYNKYQNIEIFVLIYLSIYLNFQHVDDIYRQQWLILLLNEGFNNNSHRKEKRMKNWQRKRLHLKTIYSLHMIIFVTAKTVYIFSTTSWLPQDSRSGKNRQRGDNN